MILIAPLFLEDSDTTSSLVLANGTSAAAGFIIKLRDISGSEIGTVHRQLEPHQQREISIESLLAGMGKAASAGSIAVLQDAGVHGMAIASQLLLTRIGGANPSSVDEELTMPRITGSSTLRGVADESFGTALLAIASTVGRSQEITLRCLSPGTEQAPASISLAPYATVLISNCQGQGVQDFDTYVQSTNAAQLQPGARSISTVEGYELTTDGGPGAIAAFGIAPHRFGSDIVFSAVPFLDPAGVHSANSVVAGAPVGAQPLLPNGAYKPRISFANFAATPAHVTISLASSLPADPPVSTAPGSGPEQLIVRRLTIARSELSTSISATCPRETDSYIRS